MDNDYVYDYDGGIVFANDDEFYKHEGLTEKINIKDRIAKFEKKATPSTPSTSEQSTTPIPPPQPISRSEPQPISSEPISRPPPIPQPIARPTSQPIAQPPPQPIQMENIETQAQPRVTHAATQAKPSPIVNKPSSTHTTYIVKDYRDDPMYVRLYDWSLGYIPSYFPYLRRKKLEEYIANTLNREMLEHRSAYELQRIIKSVIDSEMKKDISPYIVQESVKEKSLKSSSKKSSSKKSSSKKSSKKKSSSKKTSKKPSKKPSKKSSKKSKSSKKEVMLL